MTDLSSVQLSLRVLPVGAPAAHCVEQPGGQMFAYIPSAVCAAPTELDFSSSGSLLFLLRLYVSAPHVWFFMSRPYDVHLGTVIILPWKFLLGYMHGICLYTIKKI